MKKIITITFILTNLILFGQNNYVKVEKGKCKVDHSCNLEHYYDDFQERESFRIGIAQTNLTKVNPLYEGTLYYQLDKEFDKDKKLLFVSLTFFGSKEGCRNKDSYVHFILKNGEKFKVESMIKSLNCRTSYISIILTDEIMEVLLKNEISKIRLQYMDNSEDFEISEKGQKKLFKNLECINNAE